MKFAEELNNEFCQIDDDTFQAVVKTQGVYFQNISGVDKYKVATDVLNPQKAIDQAIILRKYCDLSGKKVLEIGSGLGVNHIVWCKKYNIDGYGIEPSDDGFESSNQISKQLIKLNQLDPARIINTQGESLPFDDNNFDIIYSSNVLEHTENPHNVLNEAFRVLKVGGVLQFVYPNYHSFFDGHYALFHPPVLFKSFFPWYVALLGRNPEFAKTLSTELSVKWTKNYLNFFRKDNSFKIMSLGEDIFFDRMETLNVVYWAGLSKLKWPLTALKKSKLNLIVARILISLGCFTPIVLTLKKR